MQETIGKASDKATAAKAYDSASCSAVLGVHLFRDGNDIAQPADYTREQFMLCVGDGKWITCLGGLKSVRDLVDDELKVMESRGMSGRDMPEDWGVIADMANQVTHRAWTNGRIVSVTYLGHINGELATEPANIQEMGIGPKPRQGSILR